jgi:arylsulfatase A-like enzyme
MRLGFATSKAWVACLVLFSANMTFGAEAISAKRPNIVVFLVDDMGVMDTSVPMLTDEKGQPRRFPLNDFYRTPNMEKLAERGIRFSNFHAMSVCSPTRISLLTGQNAARHRTTNWINPDSDNRGKNGPKDWNWKGLERNSPTLARSLQAAGYRTIQVGKGHFGPRDSEGADPKNLGFDVSIGGASIGAPGSYFAEKGYGKLTQRSQAAVPDLDQYHASGEFLTEALTLEANKQVSQSVKEGKPFFLYFAHYAVHSPFDSDPRFAENYASSDKPKNAKAFATLIEGMDKSLGDLMAHLDSLEVAEETMILFLGDNGSDAPLGHEHAVASSAPLRGKKGSHYEGGTRVPMIASWARPSSSNEIQKGWSIPSGAVQVQLAAVFDLFPTVIELAGIVKREDRVVDGTSLRTMLSGKADPKRPSTFLMHYPHAPHRSNHFTVWRNGDWKLVYHYFPSESSGNSHFQLFNLAADPYEQNELSGKNPEKLKELFHQLLEQVRLHRALLPLDDQGAEITLIAP